MNKRSIPEFDTKEEAFEWLVDEVDDDCMDNRRFAYEDDNEALDEYERRRDSGCCGCFDAQVKVGGRYATIGCNYGH